MGTGEVTVGDRTITTLAVVKTLFDRKESFLGYLEPFLEHCLSASEPDEISVPELQTKIIGTFGLRLPMAVIKTLLRRQEQIGHVVVRRNICLIDRESLGEVDLEPVRQKAMREQGALIEELEKYVQANFPQQDWKSGRAQEQLLAYVEQFSARVFQATMGKDGMPAISPSSAHDQHVVHSFVLHAVKEDPASFDFLTTLVQGKMLADAMYLDESEIQKGAKPLTNLEVYFDTPILLRVLGYMGDELAPPYIELLDLLETQGALARCFQINVEEAERILERAEKQVESPKTADRMSEDVYKHFARTRATSADIAIKRARLSTDLLRLRIQPVDVPRPRPRYSFDEDALARQLKQAIPAYRTRPLKTDVAALAAVYRLREGVSARTLARSKAVFVTRNYNLHKVSTEFFRQLDPDEKIPICIPMSPFTTMVWVRQPLDAPDLPKSRVIADAFAAMRPSPELWRAFNAEIDKLKSEGGISPGLAYQLRVSFESEQALMDTTLGDENEYVDGTARQVAERALENERFASQRHQERVEGRARKGGRWAARLLFALVIPLLCVGAIFGTLGVFANAKSPVPGVLQWPATVLFAAITIWSFYDGVSFRSMVRYIARRFERAVVGVVRFLWGFDGHD